jgi:YHS domain-containing protein
MNSLIYFLLWAGLFMLMMRFGCGAHVMGHGHGHSRRHDDGRDSQARDALAAAPGRDVDPVCGMTVATAGAKSAVYAGKAYFFCSPDCREKFEATPASYATRAATSPQTMEHSHEHHS